MKVHLRAVIRNKSGSKTEVLVTEMSESGARLELPYAALVDRQHRLSFGGAHPERDCELVWRKGYNAGVRFPLEGEDEDLHPRHRPAEIHKTPLADLRAIVKRPR